MKESKANKTISHIQETYNYIYILLLNSSREFQPFKHLKQESTC